ncbi:MAG: hypothetical protein K2H22_08890 [Muribaculaceae bacterium]|nr:hypothetical protein [Muribaculaceae bacterium]
MKIITIFLSLAIISTGMLSDACDRMHDVSIDLEVPLCSFLPICFVENNSDSVPEIDVSSCLEGVIRDYVFPLFEVDHITDFYFVNENNEEIDLLDHYTDVYRLYTDDSEDEEDWVETSVIDGRLLRIYWDDYMMDDDDRPLKKALLRIDVEGFESVFRRVKRPKHKAVYNIKLKSK